MTFLTSDLVARVTAVATQHVDPIAELTASIATVPAPTNDERRRAEHVGAILTRLGYDEVTIDDIANVVGVIPGKDRTHALLLAAHIDTVFPNDTPIEVSRRGDVLAAPGIGDNSLSVASVALVRSALTQLGITPEVDILVTGNVGEEGLGNLRGMRRVVDDHPRIAAAIAVEGHSLGRITNRAVGSRRLRVVLTGPGGHSWGDAGRPSTIHEAAKLIAAIDAIQLVTEPKTTVNVGMVKGGISVNTIAPTTEFVIDMRSASADSLASLVSEVEAALSSTRAEGIDVQLEVVGDRPAGEMPLDSGLVPIGIDVLRILGIDATCDASSTDANIPMSRGIPSMCIGLTTGGHVHRVDEYIRLRPLSTGFAQLLLAMLAGAHAIRTETLFRR